MTMPILPSIEGTGVAVVTPFRADGAVDADAYRRLADHLLASGADFIVALGTTAETPTLDLDEKRLLLDTARQVCRTHQKPLVGGWGGSHTDALLRQLDRLPYETCDALLSVTPYYNKPNRRGLIHHFTRLADHAPAPLILYNVPGRTGVDMDVDTILELAQHPQIMGIKEASGNVLKQLELIRRAPADFVVLSGDDALALPQMAMGMHGIISVAANAYPAAFAALVRDGRAGRLEPARRIHYLLLPIIEALFEEGNPTGIKALLAHQGHIENVLRAPLVPASDDLRQRLARMADHVAPALPQAPPA